ncbi:MAG: hypothetical protein ABSA10_03955, partial [Anaerolineales bacterium]
MLHLTTFTDNHRASTQELLQRIYAAMAQGETEFVIDASGQHDIGGPLWSRIGRELRFTVTNPGQRVGSMGMPGTEIVVNGSAPADVGWLNAGARIIVRGDGGDTTGHCAADGVIYIGGRAGTRTGSLMKHDPSYAPPQLWILKNTGSFSFEFMGGGIAVVCGYDCEGLPSVLGQRACIGMVGGTIYARGPVEGLADGVKVIIAEKECGITRIRHKRRLERDIIRQKGYLPTWEHMNINAEVCRFCLACAEMTGCPGLRHISTEYGRKMDTDITWCVNDGACERLGACSAFERVTIKRK